MLPFRRICPRYEVWVGKRFMVFFFFSDDLFFWLVGFPPPRLSDTSQKFVGCSRCRIDQRVASHLQPLCTPRPPRTRWPPRSLSSRISCPLQRQPTATSRNGLRPLQHQLQQSFRLPLKTRSRFARATRMMIRTRTTCLCCSMHRAPPTRLLPCVHLQQRLSVFTAPLR